MRIPYSYAKTNGILLLSGSGQRQEILLRDDADYRLLNEIRQKIHQPLQVHRADAAQFEQRLAEHYSHSDDHAADIIHNAGKDLDLSKLLQDLPAIEDLLESADDAPIIRMINALFTQALRDKASDIHIEAYEQHSTVRFRIDGLLCEIAQPNRALHAAMVSRIKIMADLDISEKRLPQDGRITVRLAGKPVDIRVSTLPTSHGERIVMRLLDKDPERLSLEVLGMRTHLLHHLEQEIKAPHGIILVTGPTGSGKTTTLYASILRIDTHNTNLVTVEDPVEFDLPGISQTSVNTKIDLDFSRVLRSILRQDPDVIMIGEIRDVETAQIAVQASLTGHLVLATLHTNDAASAVTRLIDMGVEPFLLSSSLSAVLAQRLLRQLCSFCKEPVTYSASDYEKFAIPPGSVLMKPVGCTNCQGGYKGRIGVFEFLRVTDDIRALVHDQAPVDALRQSAAHDPIYSTLFQEAIRMAIDGVTSLDEVIRVTME